MLKALPSQVVDKRLNPTKIYCKYCNEFTKSIEPIVLKRVEKRFCIACLCEICYGTKRRFLNICQMKMIPKDFIYMTNHE